MNRRTFLKASSLSALFAISELSGVSKAFASDKAAKNNRYTLTYRRHGAAQT